MNSVYIRQQCANKEEIKTAITELKILLQQAQTDFYPDRRKALKLALIILQDILK